jgi:NADH-quinone oxidoreductase subunit L
LALAWWVYVVQAGRPVTRFGTGRLAAFARSGLGFDALYRAAIVSPSEGTAAGLAVLDRDVLDRGLAASVTTAGLLARAITLLQTGFVRNYALAMLAGAVILVLVVVIAGVRA